AEMEDDAFGFHLGLAEIDMVLFHLEVGNAIAQQPASLGFTLIEVNLMADTRKLLGGGEACGSRADHGDLLAGSCLCGLGLDPAAGYRLVGDGLLDRLDG